MEDFGTCPFRLRNVVPRQPYRFPFVGKSRLPDGGLYLRQIPFRTGVPLV